MLVFVNSQTSCSMFEFLRAKVDLQTESDLDSRATILTPQWLSIWVALSTALKQLQDRWYTKAMAVQLSVFLQYLL